MTNQELGQELTKVRTAAKAVLEMMDALYAADDEPFPEGIEVDVAAAYAFLDDAIAALLKAKNKAFST